MTIRLRPGLERTIARPAGLPVDLHERCCFADLTILAKLASAVSRAGIVPLAA